MQITRGAAVPLDVTLSALDDGGLLGWVRLGPAGGGGAAPLDKRSARARQAAKTEAA
jgi:hypothetical protein